MTEAGKMLAFALEHRRRGCGGERFKSGAVEADGFEIVCGLCEEADRPGYSVMVEEERLDRDEMFAYVRVGLILDHNVTFTDAEWELMTNLEGFMALCRFLDIIGPETDDGPRLPNEV